MRASSPPVAAATLHVDHGARFGGIGVAIR
jgi:hypothetical protein